MMEVCDAVPVGQSFPNGSYFGDSYLRGQHRISPTSYPYNQAGQLQNTSHLTSTLTFPTTTTSTVCTPNVLGSNFTSPRSYEYYSNVPHFNSTTINSSSYVKNEPDGITHLSKLSSCNEICSLEQDSFERNARLHQPGLVESKCTVFPKSTEFPNSISSPTGLMVHNLSQWDVNDPKLPKIRQFDTFTMWPQGHCRYAYRKSASDGARRHASGWAMRNTNNHNSQILKKSCLGVLLCSTKRCPLAMRPAICDKARRRQEGRPCCMPNCNGRIYIQACRGHGGYPVTHFWREHGDTVYFQAKGTHDHIRPDLKPVRDTAGRRRRQMQLEKESQAGDLANRTQVSSLDQFETIHTKTKRIKDMTKLNHFSQSKKRNHDSGRITTQTTNLFSQPFVRPNELESCQPNQMSTIVTRTNRMDMLVNSKYHFAGTNHLQTNVCHNDQGHISPLNLQTFPLTSQITQQTPMVAEPIFPSENSDLDLEPNPIEPKSSVYPCDMSTKGALNSLTNASIVNQFGDNLTERPANSLDSAVINFNYDSYSLGLTRSEQQTLSSGLESSYPIYPLTTRLDDLTEKHSPFNKSNLAPFYQSQLTQLANSQPLINTGGTNSESTSGGLNASWSTPSPPTGGSSSLFGEIRTLQSGFDDTNSQNPVIVADSKDPIELTAPMVNMYTWNEEDYPVTTRSDPGRNLTNLGGYGLATPTHFSLGNHFAFGSDQSTVIPSLLMSSSTPVSYGQGLYPMSNSVGNRLGYSYSGTGYVAPIPFYLSSSESQSTRTDSSSETSHGSQRTN